MIKKYSDVEFIRRHPFSSFLGPHGPTVWILLMYECTDNFVVVIVIVIVAVIIMDAIVVILDSLGRFIEGP